MLEYTCQLNINQDTNGEGWQRKFNLNFNANFDYFWSKKKYQLKKTRGLPNILSDGFLLSWL